MAENCDGVCAPTTEALRRPIWGKAPGVHVVVAFLHCLMMVTRVAGLVAVLTSVRPLPQAEEETNHMKANAPVTSRSYRQKNRKDEFDNFDTQEHNIDN